MAKRRAKTKLSPFLITGLVSALVIVIVGVLIVTRLNRQGRFGAPSTPTGPVTLSSTMASTTTSSSDEISSSPETSRKANATPWPSTTRAKTPTVGRTTTRLPMQPKPSDRPLISPTAAPTDAPSPATTTLPADFGRLNPRFSDQIDKNASFASYRGNGYLGDMLVRSSNLDTLQGPNALKAQALAKLRVDSVYAKVERDETGQPELTITMDSDNAAGLNGGQTLRLVPLSTLKDGVVELASVRPYLGGSQASIRVYFLNNHTIQYVYAERVMADQDVAAWLEIRVNIMATSDES